MTVYHKHKRVRSAKKAAKLLTSIAPGSYKSVDELVAKTTYQKFMDIWADSKRRQREQKRKAGKHKCKWKRNGAIRRLTNGDKILKRPVVQAYFYDCEICGETKLVPKKKP